MAVIKAGPVHLDQCVDILFIPKVGQLYYPRRELLRAEVEKSILSGEVYVYADHRGG